MTQFPRSSNIVVLGYRALRHRAHAANADFAVIDGSRWWSLLQCTTCGHQEFRRHRPG